MMLNMMTKRANVVRLNAPVTLRITVKNSVDNPMMTANVPSTENRSFHMFIILPQKSETRRGAYILF